MRPLPRAFFRRCPAVVLAGFSLVWPGMAALGDEPERLIVLQLPYTPQFQFAGIYAAQVHGYFHDAGLKVEFRPGDARRRPVEEVLAGRAQYGIAGNSLLLGRLNGKPLVAVAAIFQHSPFVLLTRPGISTPSALIGRRITSEPASRFPELSAMFLAEGIKPSQYEVVPQQWDGLTLLDSGVDAMAGFGTNTPYDLEREGVKFGVIRPADYGVDFYGDTLFTNEDEARRHPEQVVALRHALQRGWEYAIEHQAEMIDWILRELPDRPARVTREKLQFEAAETARLVNANLVGVGHMNPGRWRRMAETLVQLGLAPDTQRLEGFLFQEPASHWQALGWWLGGGLAVATLAILAGFLTNIRLKKLVEKRTRELQRAEVVQRELFDLAPVPIVIEDYVAVEAMLAQLRADGVTDLRGHLQAQPERVKEFFRAKRIVDANANMLARTGCASVDELDRQLPEVMTPPGLEMFIEELVALWEGREALQVEKTYTAKDGETVHTLLNWSVGMREGRRDLSRVRLAFTDITGLKLAEAELRLSEERYRQLFDLSPVAMLEFDYLEVRRWFQQLRAEGVTDLAAHLAAYPALRREALKYSPLLQVNQATVRLSRARSKEELLQRFAEVFTPEAIEARCQNFVRLWAGLDEASGEIPLRMLDGEVRHFSFTWKMPRQNGELSFTRTQTAIVDITEQRRAQEALRESEERYRSLFETTPNPMYIFDVASLGFVAVNEAAVRKYGYSREEFLAMSVMDIRPADEADRLRHAIATQSVPGANPARVWHHRHKDGTIIDVEVATRTLLIGGRQCMLVLPFDITERLTAEQALRESETRYRELFEKAPAGVYRSSSDGFFLAANPALARMLGATTTQELVDWDARHRGAPFYVQPGRRAEFLAAIAVSGQVESFESEVYRIDGSSIWISENVRQVRDAGGRILYHEGFVTDITLHRRLDQEMQRASKLEAVGILAGGIAHDFNNILTVVLGNVALAEMDLGAEAPGTRLLREAKRATLRARDLTQQLLTFAKGGEPVRGAVSLPELLRESTDFSLHGAKARADFQIAADLWPADADKGQIGQVIQNLVINSVQAMPEGGRLKVGAENVRLGDLPGAGPLRAGCYVHLTVADTGTGIAPEYLAKIFDPYFTTKQQGSGLGLATVYSIVKKHQGHIEVESQLGHGTTFHLWLPATTQMVAEKLEGKAVARPLAARVLFMDDEAPIREMARLFTSRLGLECELAVDGAEVIRKYQEALEANQPFEVVVMDLTVPGGMGGREALERLLKIDPAVRAIVSSGYSQDPVMASHLAHGFRGILPKPYDLEQLRQAIADTLGDGSVQPENK